MFGLAKNVYVLVHIGIESFEVIGVFSTRAKAESILSPAARATDAVYILECLLNEQVGRRCDFVHEACVDTQYGDIVTTYTRLVTIDPHQGDESGVKLEDGLICGWSRSMVSAEHAAELARKALSDHREGDVSPYR